MKDSNKKWNTKWFYSSNVLPSLEAHYAEAPWVNPFWEQENLTMLDFEVIRPKIA